MEVLFRRTMTHSPKIQYNVETEHYTRPKPKPKGFNPLWFFMAAIVLILTVKGLSDKPFIKYDKDGKPVLADWRKKKLIKELGDLEEAEQYVLLATNNGLYPCFSCPNSSTIHLNVGEVWKYGFTTKTDKTRYTRQYLGSRQLTYITQLEGTITECLKEEKRKIYNYAILPENLKRTIPLIRPAGNHNDN